MNSSMVKSIFKEALNLTVGQSLELPIESEGHGVSFRTMFYRERMKYLNQGMHTTLVVSLIRKEDGSWIATIKCQKPLVLTLHKEDGTSQELPLNFGVVPTSDVEISEDVMEILKKHRTRKEKEKDNG